MLSSLDPLVPIGRVFVLKWVKLWPRVALVGWPFALPAMTSGVLTLMT